jgi:hypothetical protein
MTNVLGAFAFLLGANLASAGALALSMHIEPPEVKAGTWPVFVVTITNTSNDVIRILDFAARGDLQGAYLPIEVRDGSRTVDMPHAIDDPGPLSDDAYRSLGPHQSEIVGLRSVPAAIHLLEPGQYTVTVQYRESLRAADTEVIHASASLVVHK